MLTVVTPPAAEPVSRADAKLHCRVTGTAEDTMIDGLIVAARKLAEDYTRRTFITTTFAWSFDLFPCSDWQGLTLPRLPAASVTHVKYYDAAGVLQTFDAANYFTALGVDDGRIELTSTGTWPEVQDYRPNAVVVTFVAGYGAAATAVPEPITQAIKIIVGTLYENRQGMPDGVTPLAGAAMWLLAPYRSGLLFV
jgi:uncharacterized phiE125 gp8 family phage protein